MLTIERLGLGNTFSAEEFELVQLFAAQVSIALQNAEVFQAVEIRARTDDLTGLLNHGTFQEWLERSVRDGTPFSLIMLDLDDFRNVNNDLGHQAGDGLLRRIAGEPRPGRPRLGPHLPLRRRRVHVPAAQYRRGRRPPGRRACTGRRGRHRRRRSPPRSGSRLPDGRRDRRRTSCWPPTAPAIVAKRGGRDRIVTAAEGLALAAELRLQPPTPVDSAAPPAA